MLQHRLWSVLSWTLWLLAKISLVCSVKTVQTLNLLWTHRSWTCEINSSSDSMLTESRQLVAAPPPMTKDGVLQVNVFMCSSSTSSSPSSLPMPPHSPPTRSLVDSVFLRPLMTAAHKSWGNEPPRARRTSPKNISLTPEDVRAKTYSLFDLFDSPQRKINQIIWIFRHDKLWATAPSITILKDT